jgi:hypothetical protein
MTETKKWTDDVADPFATERDGEVFNEMLTKNREERERAEEEAKKKKAEPAI